MNTEAASDGQPSAVARNGASFVHCVREIGPGSGVSGVAYELDRAFRDLGVESKSFTMRDLGFDRPTPPPRSFVIKKVRHIFDVVYYSTVGTVVGWLDCRGRHSICHNDSVFGELYVNHGLHRAMLARSGNPWKKAFRNPLHLFLWAREWVRFSFGVHRRYICFSRSEKEQMEQFYPRLADKIRIIPNGVNLDRYHPDPVARATVRKDLHLDENDFVLVFVGHEFERKGLDYVIEALKLLSPHVKLVVAGGDNRIIAQAKKLAEKWGVLERCTFLGVVSVADQVIKASDAMVLPSRFESWALVGLEAMACGLPALLKPTGGIPDYLKDGENGFFIEQDAAQIASRVNALLTDPALRERMRRNALATAEQYSWKNIARRYLAVFDPGT